MRIASPAATRRIIVNADDFGLSAEVNAGIIDSHRHGILSSATIMANGPAFDEAVELARANPGLGVGLHLNLVRGRPLAHPEAIPLLVEHSGCLRPFRWRGMTREFLAQAEREYRLQFEKALAAGLHPTHIDFEKHHAWQCGLYTLANRLAEDYGVGAIRNLREPVAWSVRKIGWPGAKRVVMASLLRGGVELFGGRGGNLRTPDRLLGQAWIGRLDENAWIRLLEHLPPGTSEVMTHPGRYSSGMARHGGMGKTWLDDRAREEEKRALTSPKVAEKLALPGIERITFGDL